ncbi:serine-rich adhesin for platelets [Anabrus simplex]|uniref:serine-rich adhesin for platelets n=1 Tax=Anabrus simplex TaxID=316456 RepID=UPI0035A2AFD6
MKGSSSKSFPEEDTASVKPNEMCDTSNSLPDKSSEVHQSLSVNISQKENSGIKNTVISTKLGKTLSVNISQKKNSEVKNTIISTKLISEDTLGSSINESSSEATTVIPCEEDHYYRSRGTVAEHVVKNHLTSGETATEHDVKKTSSRTKSCPKVVSSPPGIRRLRQRRIPEKYRSDSFLNSGVAPVIAAEIQSGMKNKLDKQNNFRLTRSVKKGKVAKSSGVKIRKKVKLFNKDKCGLVLNALCMENKLQEELKATVELASKLSLKTNILGKEVVACTSDHDDKGSKDQHLIKPVVIDLVNDIEDEVHSNTNLISKIEKNVICTPQSLIIPTDKEIKIFSSSDISFVQLGTSTDSPVVEMNESGTTCSVVKCQTKDDEEIRSTDMKANKNYISDQKLHTEDKCQEKDDKAESRSIDIKANGNDISDQKLHPEDTSQEKDDKAESRSTDIKANGNDISDQKLHPEDTSQEKDDKADSRSTDINASGNDISDQKLHPEDTSQEKDDKADSRSTDIKANGNDISDQKLHPEDTSQEKDDKADSRSTDIKANGNDISDQKLHSEDKHHEKDNEAESRSADVKEGKNENSCQKLALSPTVCATASMPPATVFVSPSSLKGKNKPKGKKKYVSFDFPEESLKSNDNESVSIITSDANHPASRRNIMKGSDCDASFLKSSPDKLSKSNILEETNRSYDMQKALNNNPAVLPIDGGKLSRASRICRLVMSPRKLLPVTNSVSSSTLQDESNNSRDETMSREQHSSPARKLDVSPSVSESSSPSSAKRDGTCKTSPQTEGRLSRATRILQLVTSPVQEPQSKISAECTKDGSLNEDGGQDKSTNKEESLENTEELLTKSGTSENNKCTGVANSDNLLAMNAASSSGPHSSSSSTLPKVNEVTKQESPIQSIISRGKNKERSKRKSVRFNIPDVMSDSSEETSVCENDEPSDVQNLEEDAEVQNECKLVPNSDPTADSELNRTHAEEESNIKHEMSKLPTKVSEGSYSRASRICNLVISPLTRKNIETSFTKREAESPRNMEASSVRRERDNSPLQKLSPITGNSRTTRASRIFNLVCPNKDDNKTGQINASPKLDSTISALQVPLKIPPSDDVSNEITKSMDDQTRLSALTCKVMDSEMMRTPPIARRSLKRKLLDESNLTPDKEAKIFVRSPHPDVMFTSSSEVDEGKEASRIHPTREINDLPGSQLLLGKERTLTCPVTSEVCDKSSRETVDSDSIIKDSDCEERVSGNESADVHMNGHLNEDQLSCENCSATFTQEEDLKTHVNLVHMKSSECLPWILKCEVCRTSFHSKPKFLVHMKRFHGRDTKPSNKTVK